MHAVARWKELACGPQGAEDRHRTPHAMHIEDKSHFRALVAEGVVAAARAAPAVRVMVHRRARQPSAPPTAA